MSVAAAAARLVARLEALKERSRVLSEHLDAASRELATSGAVPDIALVDEIDTLRSEFVDIRRQTLSMAAALEVPTPLPASEVTSLLMLERLLRSIADVVERQSAIETKRKAMTVLGRVLELQHRDDPMFPPLVRSRLLAEELYELVSAVEWPATHPETDPLADGSHPLAALVEFVERQGDLDDARWELLHDTLAASFGRPLAVAGARGKLVFPQAQAPESTALPPRPAADDDEDDWPTLAITTPPPSCPDGVDVPDSGEAVATLAWRALAADRPELAFLIATLEEAPSAAADIPAWLLRALVLGSHVRYPNGDIALQLTDDFAGHDLSILDNAAEGEDVRRALQLLVVAAALRPALVAPDTGAWTMLRASADGLPLPALQGFARRIADYGERDPPLNPHTLAPTLPPMVWRDMMEDLLREIGTWRVRHLGIRSPYPPAADVWRRWLRPDGVIHALLAPLTLDPQGLETARGLVDRLSNQTQIDWEIADTDRRLLGRLNGPDISRRGRVSEQLVDRVREAVGFARRWIMLQERRPGYAGDEPQRAGQRLARDLAELHPATLEELTRARLTAESLPLRAALVQCEAALAGVDALVGGGQADSEASPVGVREPPIKAALNDHLLLVPGVSLDENWRPRVVDQDQVQNGLRKLIGADSPPDWRAVFEAYRGQHDHLATAQVLASLELRDAARGSELAELRALRADDLQQSLAELREDLETTRQLLDVAAAEGRLSEDTRARLLNVIEHVERQSGATLRIGSQQSCLTEVRQQLQRLATPQAPAATAVENALLGRTRESSELLAADGPHFLVSAAGMGASDLLQAAATTAHAPHQARVALVVDLGGGPAVAERFWQLLANATEAALGPGLADREVDARLVAWLDQDPARRVWLLVDHADSLVEWDAEATAPFELGRRLADLMSQRSGRVKVVLSGALQVLRAARTPGHPLAANGYVRLRPLIDDGGWLAAGDLLERSLRPLTLESTAVAARVLSLANFEPSSIERLGALLAQRARSVLTPEDVESAVNTREGASVLTANLRATLQDDPRHAIVLYCLALDSHWSRDSHGDQQAEGVTSRWLGEQVTEWCPLTFQCALAEGRFVDLLQEMVDLGLLRQLESDRFILGSPNLARFLGSEEDLMSVLIELSNRLEAEAEVHLESNPAGRDGQADLVSRGP